MIKIEITDGELSIRGKFNLGYMGIYKDEQISIYDDVSEIRKWDIVKYHFDSAFTDNELAEYLTEYFNNFEAKIQANIKQVNNNFLINTYEWAEGTGLVFWEVPEITNRKYILKNADEDFDPYEPLCHHTEKIMQEYEDTPNDGSIQKTDVEAFLRENIPLFNLDAFLAGIIPEYMSFGDGNITFQCSDSIDSEHKILCGAYNELDENLTFCDWHNF